MYLCRCKDCKKAARKGKVLGTRNMGFWLSHYSTASGKPEYYYGPVSDYVKYPKFAKGKRVKRSANVKRKLMMMEME